MACAAGEKKTKDKKHKHKVHAKSDLYALSVCLCACFFIFSKYLIRSGVDLSESRAYFN